MSSAFLYVLHYPWQTVVGTLVYIGVAMVAVLRGRRAKRLVGGALLVNFLLTFVFSNYGNAGGFQAGILLLDVCLFAFFLLIASLETQLWLMLTGSVQFVAVCAHSAKFLDPTIRGRLYVSTVILCGYAVVVILAIALFRDWRSEKGGSPWRVQRMK